MNLRRKLLLGAFALLPLLALSNSSLWIDEANSALKAIQPSASSWWQVMASEKGSDLQMPFYMFYLWAWEKIAGHSELALRLANVPWLAVAHFALYRLCRRRGYDPLPLLAIASVNPFLWFYLNEARPYLMQYAASCMVLCGLSGMFAPKENGTNTDAWYFAKGILILAGTSLLATLWVAGALAAFAFLFFRLRRRIQTRELAILGATFIPLIALAGYYLWTLSQGARGSSVGQMEFRNVAYAAFQLAGFRRTRTWRPAHQGTRTDGVSWISPSVIHAGCRALCRARAITSNNPATRESNGACCCFDLRPGSRNRSCHLLLYHGFSFVRQASHASYSARFNRSSHRSGEAMANAMEGNRRRYDHSVVSFCAFVTLCRPTSKG